MVASYGELNFNLIGLLLAVSSELFESGRLVAT